MTLVATDLPAMCPLQLTERALGVRPVRAARQGLSESGKLVYRVDLPDGKSVALRTSDRPHTFAFTKTNLQVLAALGLPVQNVLSSGSTETGGSYVVLNWIAGRDLIHELPQMTQGQMTRLAGQIVECQRRVGGLPRAAKFGWAPIGRSGNLEKWSDVFGPAASASEVDDGSTSGKLRARLCALRSRVEPYFETVQPIPFLDDVTTKNVLVENGELSGIIDVDFICYGDPLMSVGATLASLVSDVQAEGRFYGDELVRLWNPDPRERLALWFYASLWAIGSLQLTHALAKPDRAQRLANASDGWLNLAEARGSS